MNWIESIKVLDELSEVNEKIRKIEESEYQRAYWRKNREKKKEANARWYKKNGKEYQRKYYIAKKRLENESLTQ